MGFAFQNLTAQSVRLIVTFMADLNNCSYFPWCRCTCIHTVDRPIRRRLKSPLDSLDNASSRFFLYAAKHQQYQFSFKSYCGFFLLSKRLQTKWFLHLTPCTPVIPYRRFHGKGQLNFMSYNLSSQLTHDVSARQCYIVYLPGSIQARAFKIPSLHLIAQ